MPLEPLPPELPLEPLLPELPLEPLEPELPLEPLLPEPPLEPLRSRSLWDFDFDAARPAGPEGEQLVVARRDLTIERAGKTQQFAMLAAAHEDEVQRPINEFRDQLMERVDLRAARRAVAVGELHGDHRLLVAPVAPGLDVLPLGAVGRQHRFADLQLFAFAEPEHDLGCRRRRQFERGGHVAPLAGQRRRHPGNQRAIARRPDNRGREKHPAFRQGGRA